MWRALRRAGRARPIHVAVPLLLCLALVALSVWNARATQADAALAPISSVAALGPEVATPEARPIGIAFDRVARRMYVANNRSTALSIVDAATNVVLATVRLDAPPNQLAVNPLTGRVYVLKLPRFRGASNTR